MIMHPIKLKSHDSLISEFSLYSLIDKSTQTECHNEEVNVIVTKSLTEQDIPKEVEIREILNNTSVISTSLHIESIKQYKEDDKKEDIKEDSNNACIIISNQETHERLENNDEDILRNKQLINIINKDDHTHKSSYHTDASNEKVTDHISFINTSIDKNSKHELPKEISGGSEVCTPEMRIEHFNDLAQGLKTCLSNTLSVIENPICQDICSKPKEPSIERMTNLRSLDTPSVDIITTTIKRSIESLVSKVLDYTGTNTVGAHESKPILIFSQSNSFVDPEIEESSDKYDKVEEKRISSPNKLCELIISYAPSPRQCSSDMVSTQEIESQIMIPLINEMNINNDFATEDYVFNNNQLVPLNLDLIHNFEDTRVLKPGVDDIELSAASDTTNVDSTNIKDNEAQVKINDGRIQEPTSDNCKKCMNLDRISEKSEVKPAEEPGSSSSGHNIKTVIPRTASHNFDQPPPRGFFTTFKSIFKFFGEKNIVESDSRSTSEISDSDDS